jgi:TonB family protein
MFQKEQLSGIAITLAAHALLLLWAYFYVMPQKEQQRAAFIEVTLGEFKSGSPSKRASQKSEELKKRINPSQQIFEEEKIDQPKENLQQTKTAPVKAADLAKVNSVNSEDIIQKTDSDEIDPTKKSADKVTDSETAIARAEQDRQNTNGQLESGNPLAAQGASDAAPGKGNDQDKSAPYELQWEGDIQRSPLVQPMPGLTENFNALVRLRFEVRPDGSVGRIIPLKKSGSPNVDQEVQRTIRSWRFSALPENVPQQAQWGTITFRFVLQ